MMRNTAASDHDVSANAEQNHAQTLSGGMNASALCVMQHSPSRESDTVARFSRLFPRLFPSSSRLFPRLFPSLLGTVKRRKKVSQGTQLQGILREEASNTHAHILHGLILESTSTRKERG